MNYNSLVQGIVEEFGRAPIDLLGIGDASGESAYLDSLKSSYVRTVRDIDSLFGNSRGSKHVLELGSYLGVVSIALKRIGYNVSALDIPEYYNSDELKKLYEKNEIPFFGLNLRHDRLPYKSESIDAVIACEVMEHFNFNPLPVLSEINRVLKNYGFLYVGMPNQANILNRLKLVLGQSIHNPVDDFFRQLDRNDNMIVGLHWREYTLNECIQLINSVGFETVKTYFFSDEIITKSSVLRRLCRKLLYLYPPFRPSQVVIGKKVRTPTTNFWIPDAIF